MNSIITTILALLALFYILGKSADLAIYHLKIIAKKLGIGVFFLGLTMGFFTSFPELAIGINTIIEGVPNVSLGNLFGGLMVLFGLVLGISIYLQRKIDSDYDYRVFGIILLFLFVPILFGLDGTFGTIDGLIITISYFVILFILYYRQKHTINIPHIIDRKDITKHTFLFLLGLVMVLLVANFTVHLTVGLLSYLPLSKFVVGIIIFSIGTNFPEIVIAFRSWRNNAKELSFSNLLGSGMANILLVGVFSIMRPFSIKIDNSYYLLIIGIAVLLSLLFLFYRTGRSLKRGEGLILIIIYLLFIVTQIIFEESI
ncbi:hypothetical protein KKH39_00210 [Patescibacteria group bacterium]|nr:hypothetical protein [Patescibacteria group bacterium]